MRARPAAVWLAACFVSVASGADLQVTVTDDADMPVADAIVYAVPGNPVAKKPRGAVIDQKNRQFVPRVSVVQVGAAVRFPNSDNIRHSVFSFSEANHFELKLYAGTPASPVLFPNPGIVTLGCNIHDKMSAWVLVVETPYFARTDASGRATLKGLTPDTYSLRAWRTSMRKPPASGEDLEVGADNPASRKLRVPSAPEEREEDAHH
jgi:plastocyanin